MTKGRNLLYDSAQRDAAAGPFLFGILPLWPDSATTTNSAQRDAAAGPFLFEILPLWPDSSISKYLKRQENTRNSYETLKLPVAHAELKQHPLLPPSVTQTAENVKLFQRLVESSHLVNHTILARLSEALNFSGDDQLLSFHRDGEATSTTLVFLKYPGQHLHEKNVGLNKHTGVIPVDDQDRYSIAYFLRPESEVELGPEGRVQTEPRRAGRDSDSYWRDGVARAYCRTRTDQ
ncbi:hypothetical protein BDZ88DRAFT_456391 [Geranomyces variabilis]|nr:hypothetical protein BDZ88DRAFT_456391 [Geranomyces variabilis]KAJ3133708.1 hypothetical protein HDU90_005546 [Geranomyces variabilis]